MLSRRCCQQIPHASQGTPLMLNTPASLFSTSAARLAHRAIVFKNNGDPTQVLSVLTYPSLPPPPANSVNVRFRLSPINPSDINVVEGVYPTKPVPTTALSPGAELKEPVSVPGNEGLAEVTEVGDGVHGLSKGDWVTMAKSQPGTWSSARVLGAGDVIKVDKQILSEVNAATITVNPPTAYNMLRDFVHLKEGDWVVQNGANSAVGQAVIQIAAHRSLKTINFVRARDNLDALKEQLKSLGATEVLTYDDLNDKETMNKIRDLTKDRPPRLLLNCVSGPATAQMTRLLGSDASLVSYGAMSKKPLTLPTGALIFKGLRAEGFHMSKWYATHGREEREALLREIAELKLKEPEHEIVTVRKEWSDEEAGERVKEVIGKIGQGMYGKKVLLRIEDPE